VSLAFYRWLFATLIILPFAWKYIKVEWPAIRKSWHYLFWAALTGIALFNTFVYVGAHYTTAINLALIGTTSSPIIATILAAIFLKERIGWQKLTGLILCIVGVLYLLCKGDITQLSSFRFSVGDLWVLAGGFCFAVYNTMVKKKPSNISPINFLFTIFFMGALIILPFFIWEASKEESIVWDSTVVFSIAYLAIGASVISFILWNKSIGRIGAARTILFGNLIPIFSTLGSVIFLQEKFLVIHLVSMIIVFSGILVANLPGKKSLVKK
jgi:drug/metabolite transporter (DMT)-like permease